MSTRLSCSAARSMPDDRARFRGPIEPRVSARAAPRRQERLRIAHSHMHRAQFTSPCRETSSVMMPSRFQLRLTCALAGCLFLLAGCGYSQGQLLYLFGFGRRAVVKAKFRLTEGPVLILVDDPSGRVDWPPATRYLADGLSQELIKHKAAGKIIPRRTLDNLRRRDPDFATRSCHQIGERAGAKQVLWIQVRDFYAQKEFSEPRNAAYFNVAVKVINPHEKKSRSRVRLWPMSPEGHDVTVALDGATVASAKTKDDIAKELSRRLAAEIARLFYDYRPGDFEPYQ